jgi:hypothetical protein
VAPVARRPATAEPGSVVNEKARISRAFFMFDAFVAPGPRMS